MCFGFGYAFGMFATMGLSKTHYAQESNQGVDAGGSQGRYEAGRV
jgi:hypothetical protein